MKTKYSIAQARNQFSTLIRELQTKYGKVQVTNRGEPVAVILSVDEYERLLSDQPEHDFWQAYLDYREQWKDITMDIEGDIWSNRCDCRNQQLNPGHSKYG